MPRSKLIVAPGIGGDEFLPVIYPHQLCVM
jgi:hypothetical protein